MDHVIFSTGVLGAVFLSIVVILPYFLIRNRRRRIKQARISGMLKNVEQRLGTTGLTSPFVLKANLEAARQLLERILALSDKNSAALYYYGLYHFKSENFEEARIKWKQAVASDPDNPIPYTNLGNFYFERKDYNKAVRHFIKAIQIDNIFLPPRVGIGDVRYAQGKIYSAMGAYSMANKINGFNAAALVGLGKCYRLTGNIDKAKGCLEQAYALDRTDRDASVALAGIYLAEKDYHRSYRILDHAIRLYPKCPILYKQIGDVHHQLNRQEEAVDAYMKFLRFNCDPEKLANFVRIKFERCLALEIISDLVKGEKNVNYAKFIKQLDVWMMRYLVSRSLLGVLNSAKRKAYQAFSHYFVTNVILTVAQERSNPMINGNRLSVF